MIIQLYNFAKKPNSTARPEGTGLQLDGQLRGPCSLQAPTIAIQRSDCPADTNYMYVPEYGRYYFISWAWEPPLWVVYGTVDALASWRDEIGSSLQYILRSSAARDETLVDTLYPVRANAKTVQVVDSTFPWTGKPLSYTIGVVGKGGTGGVTYYSMTPAQFQTLASALLGDGDYLGSDFGNLTKEVVKAQCNPFQYVCSVLGYPFAPSGGASVGSIPLGWWDADVSALRTPPPIGFAAALSVPLHPMAASRSTYYNKAPYTRLSLWLPCFGTFAINPAQVGDQILVGITVDPTTGVGVATISSNGVVIDRVSGQVGVPSMLAQTSSNFIGAATAGITAGLSAIAGSPIGAAAGITSAIDSTLPQVSRSGTQGSYAEFSFKPTLTCTFFFPSDQFTKALGSPLCSARRPADIPGYMIVSDARVEAPASLDELQTIKNYMEGGFYYE